MSKIDIDPPFGLRWKIPVILIFLAGGLLQYIGILTPTQTNWLAIFLFGHVFLTNTVWKQIKYESLLFVLMLLVAFSHFQRDTPIPYTLTYFYYIACVIVAAVSGRVYAARIHSLVSTRSFFKIAKVFLFIQLIVVILQSNFTDQFISWSLAPIGYTDAIFGTFFLQSDAALAAVCELLVISAFFLQCRGRDRVVISALSFAIIYLGNSKASQIAFILLLVLLIVHNIIRRLQVSRKGYNVITAIAITFIAVLLYGSLSGFLIDLFEQATRDYYLRSSWISASRFSPVGQMIAEGIDVFGKGALTYYNPITKEWLYNAGFSTIYILYIDFGMAGLFLYLLYQVITVMKNTRDYYEFSVFMCVFVFFMAFNFALTDIAFVFFFNIVLRLNYLRGRRSFPLNYAQIEPPLGKELEGTS